MSALTLQSMPRLRLLQSSADFVVANMESSRVVHRTTSPNVNYHRDMHYVCQLIKWILGSIGIWPITIRGTKCASGIVIVFYSLVLSVTIVPFLMYVLYDEKDMQKRLKLCGLVSFCTIGSLKYCIFAIRRPKIMHCIEYIKKDWWQVKFKSDREQMLKNAAIGRALTISSASIMYSAGFIFHVVLPFFTESYNRIVNNQTLRPQVYPTHSAFDQTLISPIYEIMYTIHCICGYTLYSVTVGACGLAALFASHACGQIQVILSRLKDLIEGKNFEKFPDFNQRIANIVKGHVKVIRFVAIVEEVLQEVCLVEFSITLFTVCLLEYFCIVDWQHRDNVSLMTYFMLLISFCLNLYILNYTGEVLMEKSGQIGSTCCMINWYELSPISARNLILIIGMSSHPVKITAGRMVDLSLTTYGNVLKTSVAYLSFLRTLVV